jgi:hypothetical protein
LKVIVGEPTFSKEISEPIFLDFIVSKNVTMEHARAEAMAMEEHGIYHLLGEIVRYMPGFSPQVYTELKKIVPEILTSEQVYTDDLLILFILSSVFQETLTGFEKAWAGKIVGRA